MFLHRHHAPSAEQLSNHALRQIAGAALVVLAAVLVHRTGHVDQLWQYVAIAAALAPQTLVDLLALGDHDRRTSLRISRRPRLVLLVPALLLAVSGPWTLLAGGAVAVGVAAISAAVGLAIAAAPVTVTLAPRSA